MNLCSFWRELQLGVLRACDVRNGAFSVADQLSDEIQWQISSLAIISFFVCLSLDLHHFFNTWQSIVLIQAFAHVGHAHKSRWHGLALQCPQLVQLCGISMIFLGDAPLRLACILLDKAYFWMAHWSRHGYGSHAVAVNLAETSYPMGRFPFDGYFIPNFETSTSSNYYISIWHWFTSPFTSFLLESSRCVSLNVEVLPLSLVGYLPMWLSINHRHVMPTILVLQFLHNGKALHSSPDVHVLITPQIKDFACL